MGTEKNNKSDVIREMLLKTVNKSPDLFSYYTAIMEAKELLQMTESIVDHECMCNKNLLRELAEG